MRHFLRLCETDTAALPASVCSRAVYLELSPHSPALGSTFLTSRALHHIFHIDKADY